MKQKVEELSLGHFNFASYELSHLFGLTYNPSDWQPGNVTPARPNNWAINATKLQHKCKFNNDTNAVLNEQYMRTSKSNGLES